MSSYLSPVIQHNDQRIFVKGSIKEKRLIFCLIQVQNYSNSYKINGVRSDCKRKMPTHSVRTNESSKSHFCPSSRWGNWLATLTAPNIVIQRAPVTNPSSCMMSAMTEFVLEDEGEMTHDCVTLTYAATSEIAETPIENAELELFVNGFSCSIVSGKENLDSCVTL